MRRIALLVPALALLAACDPCSGVSGCDTGPHLTYEGRVIGHFTKAGVPGTRVEFRRTGGVALERDTVSVTAGEGGRFVFSVEAAEAGTVTGDVAVDAPEPYGAYVVRGLTLSTVSTGGDGRFLSTWVADPFEDLQWELRRRSDRQLVKGARVEFRRTGGVPIFQQPYVTSTDDGGRFRLRVSSPELGIARGDLLFTPAGRTDVWTVPGIEIGTLYEDRDSRVLGPMLAGPWLGYYGKVVWADDGTPVVGAEVRFRRTGGLEALPAQFTVTSNFEGRFPLEPVPVDARAGTLVAELVVRAPGAAVADTIRGIQMPTFEADEYRQLGIWPLARP